jgi:hypothetical protein
LGLVVGKKFMRTAVGRNVIKRMTREIFRRRRASLPARDWVLRLAVKLDKPDAMMRQILASDIQSLFDRAMAREVLKRMPDSPVKGLTLKGKPQIPQAGTARKTRDNRDGSTPPVMLLAHS